jgi:hypothetical protein
MGVVKMSVPVYTGSEMVEVSDRTLMLAGQLPIVWLPNCKIILRVFEKPKALRLSIRGPKGDGYDIANVDGFEYEKLYEEAIEWCKDPLHMRSLYD